MIRIFRDSWDEKFACQKSSQDDFAQKSVEILDILTEIGFLLYFIDYRGKLEPISDNQKIFENLYAKREQVDIFCSKEKIC